jgi:hypothetical protein
VSAAEIVDRLGWGGDHGGEMSEPPLIDQFMPDYDVSIVYSRVYRAPTETCFDAIVTMDLLRTPLIRIVINASGIPPRLIDAVRGHRDASPPSPPTFRLRDMPEIGWIRLGERPGTELLLGDVTKPWDPRGTRPAHQVRPEKFAAFDEPGYVKITDSTRADPYGERSCILTLESRVLATDEHSRRLFGRYWAVVGPFSHLIRRSALRRLARELG